VIAVAVGHEDEIAFRRLLHRFGTCRIVDEPRIEKDTPAAGRVEEKGAMAEPGDAEAFHLRIYEFTDLRIVLVDWRY
jgi:hypothetical protein